MTSPSKLSPTTSTDAARPLLGLPGVGPRTAARLAAVGLERLEDLLRFAPRRYDDAGTTRAMASVVPGERVLVEGVVRRAAVRRFFRRGTLEVMLDDASGGGLLLRWFRFRGEVPARYAVGSRVRAAGQVRQGKRGLELIQPLAETAEVSERVSALRPRYAQVPGVPGALIERLCALASEAVQPEPIGVPPSLLTLIECARVLHARPPLPEGEARASLCAGRSPAHRRLAFEELLLIRLRALLRGSTGPGDERAHALSAARDADEGLRPMRAALPFAPTQAQARAIRELAAELALDRPMRRLLTGDVGSGKTLVAAAAIELCVASGRRAALLAPTALLAEQQAETLRRLLAPTGRRVGLIHAGVARAERSRLERAAADPEGALDVLVGTHALLGGRLELAGLALVIVDEQQRFGVAARAALVDKARRAGRTPHQLALSATPIPRTLALALRGELSVSHLDERPLGRAPIGTILLDGADARRRALDEVRAALAAGEQAYWICPQIDDEPGEAHGVIASAAWLEVELGRAVGLCHGRQPPRERASQMATFRAGGGVLVATTVVEVGLDVPGSTLVAIESPAQLGLGQLHQLRGRVGRGARPGRCLLVAPTPSEVDRLRLELLVREQDGLAIAEADLRQRGMGDLAGVAQSGLPSLPPLDAEELVPLIEAADRAATQILAADPELRASGHERLARALARASERTFNPSDGG